MPITLTVSAGPHVGLKFTFDRHDTLLVGRSSAAHFSLPDDPYFSRMHFLIEINPPLCRLNDLNSNNGTLVNGQKVKTADLRDGDEIRGGRTALRVSVTAAGGEAKTLDLPGGATGESTAPEAQRGAVTLDDTALAGRQRESMHPLAPSTVQRQHGGPASIPLAQVATDVGSSAPVGVMPVIPGYNMAAEIGRGGMGIVYRAVCAADGAEAAIKTIRPCGNPSAAAVGRFLREAAILKELTHERIVGFREAGETNGLLYFVMPFVPGHDAAKIVAAGGPLEVKRAVGLLLQLLDALAFAHDKGYVHRDIKPANLLVTPTPGQELLRVADFGLARTYQESALSGLTLSGAAGGTPQFMPPEQVTDFRGVRPAADQYSATATLYYLLTGRYLYDTSQPSELFRKLLLEDPVSVETHRRGLPAGLAQVIQRGLSRKPEDRYPSVLAFARALHPFA